MANLDEFWLTLTSFFGQHREAGQTVCHEDHHYADSCGTSRLWEHDQHWTVGTAQVKAVGLEVEWKLKEEENPAPDVATKVVVTIKVCTFHGCLFSAEVSPGDSLPLFLSHMLCGSEYLMVCADPERIQMKLTTTLGIIPKRLFNIRKLLAQMDLLRKYRLFLVDCTIVDVTKFLLCGGSPDVVVELDLDSPWVKDFSVPQGCIDLFLLASLSKMEDFQLALLDETQDWVKSLQTGIKHPESRLKVQTNATNRYDYMKTHSRLVLTEQSKQVMQSKRNPKADKGALQSGMVGTYNRERFEWIAHYNQFEFPIVLKQKHRRLDPKKEHLLQIQVIPNRPVKHVASPPNLHQPVLCVVCGWDYHLNKYTVVPMEQLGTWYPNCLIEYKCLCRVVVLCPLCLKKAGFWSARLVKILEENKYVLPDAYEPYLDPDDADEADEADEAVNEDNSATKVEVDEYESDFPRLDAADTSRVAAEEAITTSSHANENSNSPSTRSYGDGFKEIGSLCRQMPTNPKKNVLAPPVKKLCATAKLPGGAFETIYTVASTPDSGSAPSPCASACSEGARSGGAVSSLSESVPDLEPIGGRSGGLQHNLGSEKNAVVNVIPKKGFRKDKRGAAKQTSDDDDDDSSESSDLISSGFKQLPDNQPDESMSDFFWQFDNFFRSAFVAQFKPKFLNHVSCTFQPTWDIARCLAHVDNRRRLYNGCRSFCVIKGAPKTYLEDTMKELVRKVYGMEVVEGAKLGGDGSNIEINEKWLKR